MQADQQSDLHGEGITLWGRYVHFQASKTTIGILVLFECGKQFRKGSIPKVIIDPGLVDVAPMRFDKGLCIL